MKKTSIILAMAAVALGFTSCKQEDEPKYQEPNAADFTISVPAFQDVEFRTSAEMTDAETFNLFCSQPDYGYSAVCQYWALVSLNPEAPDDQWIKLENSTPTSAAMSIKTFELGVAINKLLKIESQEDFDAKGIYDNAYKCYFKAVCEISGVEGSQVVSSNYVSYNKVYLRYAEKKPAWIYICGDVQNEDGSAVNGFLTPGPTNLAAYNENWSLFEPNDMIGEKLFVGVFWLTPKDGADENDPSTASQFRFFTELLGWTADASLGSNEADFYCLPITDKWVAGYSGDIVAQGLGNWGIHTTEAKPVTIVVDTQLLKIYVKEGQHEVGFVGRDPEFK